MADEPRRSGRATKGQYTKDRDISEEKGAKRKGKGKGVKANAETEANDEEENAIIRCICGHYEEEEETERTMICCDSCEAWQHNDCMGLPDDYAPDKYFCEQCKPEDHKELLDAIARGEKPWEEVARKREAAAAEAEMASKKKGGKKGRKAGARPSEVPSRDPQEADGTQTAASASKATNGHKRKLEDASNGSSAHQQDTKKARQTPTQQDTVTDAKNGVRAPPQSCKSRAMSTPSRQASRSELAMGSVVLSVEELSDSQRKNVAGHLVKFFIEQTNLAVKAAAYSVPPGRTAKEVGTELGLRIEHAMYHVLSGGSGEPSEAYKNQMRTILFNVKKNSVLRDRLLSGSLSAHGLAAMDAKDMASEELQQKDAAIKKEAEKQYTVIQEQGPRIRRTHKGDEYVDESMGLASESTVSHAPVRRPSVIEPDSSQTRSPDAVSPAVPHATGEIPLPKTRPRPSVDTSRKSSTNFNIQDVWSSVQGSPDGERQQFPQLPQHQAEHRPLGPGTQADADIDELLKDENENEDVESPPYSPKASGDENEIVWRGMVNGGTIGKFHASARYAAGAHIGDLRLSWQQLIPSEIPIEGRIDPVKADEYLCGLQYSASSDVVIVSISEPEDAVDRQNFTRLFDYFKNRHRYGVGVQHSNPAIKDIYLIPLEAGSELPELLQLLEQHELKGPVPERLLLIPFVVKNTELASATPRDHMTSASPLVSVPPGSVPPVQQFQPQPPPRHDGSVPIPYGQSPAPLPAPSSAEGARLLTTPPAQQQQQQLQQSPAAAAALQVLGPMAHSPAVLELIRQVPMVGVLEMNVVKEIILENHEAANDLRVLTSMLQEKNQPRQ